MSGARRSAARPVRKEVTFSREEWARSRELFESIKDGFVYTTYMKFAREMLMQGSVHTTHVITDPAKIRPEIARIGNNINQIAHVANATGTLTSDQYDTLVQGLGRVESILNDLFTKTADQGWQ